MDRAVIIGTFEFAGFYFCMELLDRGIEIEGIHINRLEEDPFLLEKRLQIGRNANFQENDFTSWINTGEGIEGQAIILINYYDLYMQGLNTLVENDLFNKFLLKNLRSIKDSDSRIIFLFPIQWLHTPSNSPVCEKINKFFQEENVSFQTFYLPTLYGPWQSSEYLFQQFLLMEMNERTDVYLNEREWLGDALFIEDTVKTIVNTLEHSSSGSYMIKSGNPDSWKECAEYLSIPQEKYMAGNWKNPVVSSELNEITVQSSTHFSEALKKQKRHLERLISKGI